MGSCDEIVDVIVAGGGAAGVAAAVAAARNGARVAIVERYGFFGGMATAGMVGTICGLYNIGPTAQWTSHGFAREFTERLAKRCNTSSVHAQGYVHFLPYDKFQFQRLCDDLILEQKTIEPILHATISHADLDGEKIKTISGQSWDRSFEKSAKVFVDTTGDASLIHLAGGATTDLWETNAKSVTFQIDRVGKQGRGHAGRLATLRAIAHGVESGELPTSMLYTTYIQPAEEDDVATLKLVLPMTTDSYENVMTGLEFQGRQLIEKCFEYLRKNCEPFKGARIRDVADQAGVRLGRCAVGCGVLTENQVMTAAKSSDGIARGAWPIEKWLPNGKPLMQYPPADDYYEISAEAIMCRDLKNVFAAGRCISAEPNALASARVIGIAFSTGWAAGTLAAFKALGKGEGDAIAKIRQENGGESC